MQADDIPLVYAVEDRGYETPCWIWQRFITRLGYGKATVSKGDRSQLAHVQFWEERNGPVPVGLGLDHLCRVRACVNPDHMEPTTQAENVRRGKSAKLTMQSARLIRASTESTANLAARHGVSRTTILRVRAGRSWTEDPLTSSLASAGAV